MLNGKFFTGLPPKMIDRGGVGKNRLESHFFWPDDSQSESVAETRQKRRNSLQYEQQEKPALQRKVSVGAHDVDTKCMFQKEFTKSSIQFYDKIPEDAEEIKPGRMQSILRAKQARQQITTKPTATYLKLPENVIDENYTSAKKQEVYTSKIQFYDYVDEDLNKTNSNNMRKQRMDMNDKKEMERNAKNSPKLQVKRNVSNLREVPDEPNIKQRNDYALDERNSGRNASTLFGQMERNYMFQSDEDTMPNNAYIDEVETNYRRNSGHNGNDFIKNNDMRAYSTAKANQHRKDDPEINYIEKNMRSVRLKPIKAKKHVTYEDNYVDEQDVGNYGMQNDYYDAPTTSRVGSPKRQPGNKQRQPTRTARPTTPDSNYDENINAEKYQYMETRQKPLNNNSSSSGNSNSNSSIYNYMPNNNNNSNSISNKINNQKQRKIIPKTSKPTMASPPTTMDYGETAADAQKHLRSSIIFSDSETSPTTPTSQFRRNARSSAVQRVSVGLPD